MCRLFGVSFIFIGVLLAGPAGCSKATPTSTSAQLVLKLPESVKPPGHAPERVSKLTVDGKDQTEPRDTRREFKMELAQAKATAVIEYGFWPNTYTNIIRTRKADLAQGKTTEIDFTKEDAQAPDLVKPIFFPTPNEVVEAMCKLGGISKGDVVYDIGCGDGRLVIMAVKDFGAKKGIGIDIDEGLVKKSWENAKNAGLADQVDFRAQDALAIKELPDADVVLLYMSEELLIRLRPMLQKTLKKGARVVSHRFTFGGEWQPDETRKINAKNNYDKMEDYILHLWTIK